MYSWFQFRCLLAVSAQAGKSLTYGFIFKGEVKVGIKLLEYFWGLKCSRFFFELPRVERTMKVAATFIVIVVCNSKWGSLKDLQFSFVFMKTSIVNSFSQMSMYTQANMYTASHILLPIFFLFLLWLVMFYFIVLEYDKIIFILLYFNTLALTNRQILIGIEMVLYKMKCISIQRCNWDAHFSIEHH